MDMEAGYGGSPSKIADRVRQAIQVGVVGINIEDRTEDPQSPLVGADDMCRRIQAIAQGVEEEGTDLFINARTDAFYAGQGSSGHRLQQSILRGNCYLEAGAHGIFVPGLDQSEQIQEVASGIKGPLNVISTKDFCTAEEYRLLGVARISFGPRALQVLVGHLLGITKRVAQGSLDTLYQDQVSYEFLNDLWK